MFVTAVCILFRLKRNIGKPKGGKTEEDQNKLHLCIRLARLQFELTNQDSVGGKSCNVLKSTYINRESVEVGHLFSLKCSHKGIYNSEN